MQLGSALRLWRVFAISAVGAALLTASFVSLVGAHSAAATSTTGAASGFAQQRSPKEPGPGPGNHRRQNEPRRVTRALSQRYAGTSSDSELGSAAVSSRRELIPSFENTLRRW